ncbi:MAG TPA: hypothetical protein VK641_06930 [Terriglobales bacterium]|nr:hypothetical protein [Terriglobales bacterium]
MGPFINIRRIKTAEFGKNLKRPQNRFLPILRALFGGGPGETGVFWWYFCGEFVVDAW